MKLYDMRPATLQASARTATGLTDSPNLDLGMGGGGGGGGGWGSWGKWGKWGEMGRMGGNGGIEWGAMGENRAGNGGQWGGMGNHRLTRMEMVGMTSGVGKGLGGTGRNTHF